jgi:hypothetical protein
LSAADSPAESGESVEATRDALRILITALVKVALVGDAVDTERWRGEAVEIQKRLAGRAQEVSAFGLDAIWTRAVKAAESDPAVRRDETVNPTLPTMAPIRVDQLAADLFDLDQAVRTIRDTASFG